MSYNATLVVLAAGMGSRFGGLKQVEPMGPNGEAILDYSVMDAKKAGFTKVVFIIKKAIEEDFKRLVGQRIEKRIDVEYVFQELDKLPEGYTVPEGREKPWGTGHAILCCKDVIKEPFAVVNADDFYGASAFQKIYEGLGNTKNYCMVGFRLANTITENGTVSRGVCTVRCHKLKAVKETLAIDSACRAHQPDGTIEQLSPDTVVSMNMWGFQPDVFAHLEPGFKAFLDQRGSELKSEYHLPGMVDNLITAGTKKVDVLVAEDKWYGVTYKEDKPAVVAAIKALVEQGKY